tara:strand:- start:990 stop:1148 length:159 start_codon:yes stop_codon:yes gene_type:complete
MDRAEAINRLTNMLKWSDRIGSDEVFEIAEIINLLDKNKVDVEATINSWRER